MVRVISVSELASWNINWPGSKVFPKFRYLVLSMQDSRVFIAWVFCVPDLLFWGKTFVSSLSLAYSAHWIILKKKKDCDCVPEVCSTLWLLPSWQALAKGVTWSPLIWGYVPPLRKIWDYWVAVRGGTVSACSARLTPWTTYPISALELG